LAAALVSAGADIGPREQCRLVRPFRLKPANAQTDPLPSWNEGASKQSIVEFVGRVTRQGGPDFVPPAERIATFDNDGTLWSSNRDPFNWLSRSTA
jgi:hypothetical protein